MHLQYISVIFYQISTNVNKYLFEKFAFKTAFGAAARINFLKTQLTTALTGEIIVKKIFVLIMITFVKVFGILSISVNCFDQKYVVTPFSPGTRQFDKNNTFQSIKM